MQGVQGSARRPGMLGLRCSTVASKRASGGGVGSSARSSVPLYDRDSPRGPALDSSLEAVRGPARLALVPRPSSIGTHFNQRYLPIHIVRR